MPVIVIEAPTRIGQDAKKKMLEKVSQAVDEGYNGIVKSGAEILVFLHDECRLFRPSPLYQRLQTLHRTNAASVF